MNKKNFLLLFIVCFSTTVQHAKPIITFFFKPLSTQQQPPDTDKLKKKLQTPRGTAKLALRPLFEGTGPLISGICSTYAGYLAFSDTNGQTIFPRMHDEPVIYIVITRGVDPIIMLGYTVHHLEIQPGAPAVMYKLERKQDEETDLFYWNIEQKELPEDNVIPLEAITIFAKPRYFEMPTGIILAEKGPNLELPDIYVRPGLKKVLENLYSLNLMHYFSRVHLHMKKEPLQYDALVE